MDHTDGAPRRYDFVVDTTVERGLFHRLTGDPAVPFLAVDVATTLTWERSAWHVPADEALPNPRS